MEITWKITNLERQATDGLVACAHYDVTAVDGDHSARVYGTVGLEKGEPLIDFDKLTERDVISWVKSKLDPAAVEQSLAAQIATQKNPPVLNGMPWQ